MSENEPTVDALRSIRVTDPPSQMSLLQRDTPAIRTVADPKMGSTVLGDGRTPGVDHPTVAGSVGFLSERLVRLGDQSSTGGTFEVPLVDLIYRQRLGGEDAVDEEASAATRGLPREPERSGREDAVDEEASAATWGADTDRTSGERHEPAAPTAGEPGAQEPLAVRGADAGRRATAAPEASGPTQQSPAAPRHHEMVTAIAEHGAIPVALSGSDGGARRSSDAGSRPAFRYRQPSSRPDEPDRTRPGPQAAESSDLRAVDEARQAASTPDSEERRDPEPAARKGSEGVPGRGSRSKLSAGRVDPGTTAVSTPIRPGGDAPVTDGPARRQRLSYRDRLGPTAAGDDATETATGQASVGETIPAEPTDQPTPGSWGDTTVQRSPEGTTMERREDSPTWRSGEQAADSVGRPSVATGAGRAPILDRPDRRTALPPIGFTYLSRSSPSEIRVDEPGTARQSRTVAAESTAAVIESGGPEDERAGTERSVRPGGGSSGDGAEEVESRSADRHTKPPFPVATPAVPAAPVRETLRRVRGKQSTGRRRDPDTPEPIDGESATTRSDAVDPRTGMPVARSHPRTGTPERAVSGRPGERGEEAAVPPLDHLSPAGGVLPDHGTPGSEAEFDASRPQAAAVDGPSTSGRRGSEPSQPEHLVPARTVVAQSRIGPGELGGVASVAERDGQPDAAFERQPSAPRLQTIRRQMAATQGGPERFSAPSKSGYRQSAPDPSAAASPGAPTDREAVPAGGGIETVLTRSDPARTPVARRSPVAATDQQDRAGPQGMSRTVAHAQLPASESARTGSGENLMNTESVEETVRFGETTEMPSLTLQTPATAQSESGSQEQRGPRPPDAAFGQERDVTEEGATDTGRADRRHRGPTASGRDGRTRVGRRPSPPVGRETASLYPDLTVKTLAPRIDATQREESTRDVTRRSREQERGAVEREQDLEKLLSGSGIDASPSSTQVDRLVEKLHRKLERKMRIERERRGL